jgi:pSer/pThr/pTyr-binding forkhead associated (FHA) protein
MAPSVNGQRILSDHLLAPGDLIEIGNTRIRVLAIT